MNDLELRDATADGELKDAINPRDAQAVSPVEARFTDPAAWLESLKADAELGAIADNIVWLSVTTGPATLEQVEAKWSAGGQREVRTFGSRYVTANYIARGQMLTLSAYCGVVWTEGEATGFAREKSEATALRLQETMRKVQTGLSRLKALQVRSGGALHLHTGVEGWQAHPDQAIEEPPAERCATCGVEIHYANDHWRDSAGKFDALKDGHGRDGRPMRVFDHEHGIEVVA